jgi:hypothetical protein
MGGAGGPHTGEMRVPPPKKKAASIDVPTNIGTVARNAVQSALRADRAKVEKELDSAIGSKVKGASAIASSLRNASNVTGPTHFETNCGIKVAGMDIANAVIGPGAGAHMFDDSRQIVRIEGMKTPGASVLLEFADAFGVVVPVIRDFICAVTFEEGELIGIAYEPSDYSERWKFYKEKAEHFRSLRALTTSAARLGAFRLEGEDAQNLARMFQEAKNTDPAMALYAAYAYHQQRMHRELQEMHEFAKADLRMCLFDVAMLAGDFRGKNVSDVKDVFPSFPMFAQGWSLLSPLRVQLPDSLAGLRSHLVPQLWTMFDHEGTAMVRDVILSGEMP